MEKRSAQESHSGTFLRYSYQSRSTSVYRAELAVDPRTTKGSILEDSANLREQEPSSVTASGPRYSVVTAMRDEAANLTRLALSLMSQTLAPVEWIVVDTGSSDESVLLANQLASLKPWIRVSEIGGPPNPGRGAPIVDALHHGFEQLDETSEYVLIIDCDVSFGPDHIGTLLHKFTHDPRLGLASGVRFEKRRGQWRVAGATATTVEAQLRAYRRVCLSALLPFERRMGWDVLDESRALSFGWRAKRFRESTFRHHRPVGARDANRRTAWAAQGEIAHFVGYRPAYLAFRCVYRSLRDPRAVFMFTRFARARLRHEPTSADSAAVAIRRSQQRLRYLPKRIGESAIASRATKTPRAMPPPSELLLVSSPGGHLIELVSLDDVVRPYSRIWVTEDTDDARELLAKESVVYVRGPGSRSLIHLARNLVTSWRLVGAARPRVAISAGSAIAVPFLWVARLRGAKIVLIECAGRAEGASLTRRLLEPAADRVYVQWEGQTSRASKSRSAGKAALSRTSALSARLAQTPLFDDLDLLVTVGSCSFPFERLMRAVEDGLQPHARVLVQCGTAAYRPKGALCVDFLPPSLLMACMRSARAVVCHGGIGSVALSIGAGRIPLVVPRLARLGEHLDDHQVPFARQVGALGLATIIENTDCLAAALQRPSKVPPATGAADVPDLGRDLEQYLALHLARDASNLSVERPRVSITPPQ